MDFKQDDIIIRDKSRETELKYRVTSTNFIGDIEILWGYRIKYDKRLNVWITFGQERALLPRDYRLFTEDDFHYI